MLNFESEQRFCVQATLAAGDATKTLKAAIAEEQLVVTSVVVTGLTPAAQLLYVGDVSGAVKALSLAASLAANAQVSLQLIEGLKLTKGEDLIIKPAAAGPSVHVVAEGYILRG